MTAAPTLTDDTADTGNAITSVIMPIHRECPLRLMRAVGSVLAQTCPAWELILVSDDGLDYAALLGERGLDDPRLRFASTGRCAAGPSSARNIGLSLALGDVVAFLDSDDFFEPTKLEIMRPLAIEHGVAYDNTRFCFEHRESDMGTYLTGQPAQFMPAGFFLDIAWPLFAVYHRSRFGCWRFAEPVRFAEDMLFNYTMLQANGGGYFVDQPLHNYLIRPVSLSHGPNAGHRADAAYARIVQILLEQDGPQALIDVMRRRRVVNAEYLDWLRTEQGTFHTFMRRRRRNRADAIEPAALLKEGV